MLQRLATPLVDDIESVIRKLAEFYEQNGPKTSKSGGRVAVASGFDPASPPDLKHAKLISAELNGVEVQPRWNTLLIEAVRLAELKAKSEEELRQLIVVPFRRGKKEDEGYKHLLDIDLSVQGQDAVSAWRAAYHIAKRLGVSIKAEFVWRHKPDAAFPGQSGVMGHKLRS
jgi:hypothetical protein